MSFIGNSTLTSIAIDEDGATKDDWVFFIEGSWISDQAYDLDITTPFSNFNPGTYTDNNHDNAKDLGGFQLVVAEAPEPATLALFSLGLAFLGASARRRKT